MSWQQQQDEKKKQEALLDRPLPDFLQAQLNPPVPVNPVSLGDVRAASPDVQPGSGGPMWANSAPQPDSWQPPEASSLGAAPPAQGQGSIADEHPEVDRVAHLYAKGEMSIQDALAHAKKYTYRDMPAVDTWAKLRGQKTAEDMVNVEKERTQRAYGVAERQNQGKLEVQDKRNEGAANVQDKKSAESWRETEAKLKAAALIAQHRDDTALKVADKRIAAAAKAGDNKMTQEMMMLKVDLEHAAKNLADSTRELEGLNSLVDDEAKARAVKRHEEALAWEEKAHKSLTSYRAAMGNAIVPPPQGAPSPAPAPMQANPGDATVQEPPASMAVPPPPTHSGRPDNALSPQQREQRMQQGGASNMAGTIQATKGPPIPTGRKKRDRQGIVWAEMKYADGTDAKPIQVK
jgi:hypothetical protein